jgi:hypothetical protein
MGGELDDAVTGEATSEHRLPAGLEAECGEEP